MKKILFFLSAAAFLTSSMAFAEVRMPAVFAGNMVLQREIKVPVWGFASPGEKVTVDFNGQKVSGKADSKGKWKVTLAPMKAGGPFDMTVTGKNTIKLANVLVGEVWVCSGQSNMEMMVQHCDSADCEVASSFNPNIRLFNIKNDVSPTPLDDCNGNWEICRPTSVRNFSATGYYFGRSLQKELGVPVGLISAAWGGSSAETWMTMDGLNNVPDFKGTMDHWSKFLNDKPAEAVQYYKQLGVWIEDAYNSMYVYRDLKPYAEKPKSDVDLAPFPCMPCWTYNAMINPIVPYGIKGAIWYQGETNAGRAYQYRTLMPGLIKDWRKAWGEGDFPFLIVQLANFMPIKNLPGESAWAELREAQLMTLSLANTGMAVAIDIGNTVDIHPRNKQEVGRRLSLWPLAKNYGKNVVYSGPLYKSMRTDGGKIRLSFDSIGSGLASKDDKELTGFAIAGANKAFVWANAKIEGNEVVVWSDAISDPKAVRYGWADNPVCNLYNKEGLPASPFRTDDWPGTTSGKF